MSDPTSTAARAWALLFELLEHERPRMVALGESFAMTPVEMIVLKSLVPGHTCPMQSLPSSKFHDKSTVTRVIDRLVKRGLVTRQEGLEDRRVKTLQLTAEGESLRQQILARMAVPPASLEELSERDRTRLVEILERAVTASRRQNQG